jgi:hypothetical protein
MINAGIVHQGGHRAELAVDRLEHFDHFGFVSDIGLYGYRVSSRVRDLPDDGFSALLLFAKIDADLKPVLCSQYGGGCTDPPARTRDDEDSFDAMREHITTRHLP